MIGYFVEYFKEELHHESLDIYTFRCILRRLKIILSDRKIIKQRTIQTGENKTWDIWFKFERWKEVAILEVSVETGTGSAGEQGDFLINLFQMFWRHTVVDNWSH